VRVNCEIDNIKTLKRGMKITLSIGEKEVPDVMKDIYRFMDKPIIADFQVNAKEQMERLNQITPDQRKKIYALFKDIASYTGNSPENEKENMKALFLQETHYEPFSLSNCGWELAGEFIEWIIDFCFKNGIGISEHPLKTLGDIEKYVRMCLRYKICSVCGQQGEIHHWDTIGMGRDRTKIDDSGHRKICLCRTHHTEAHTIGVNAFEDKYHVYGVIWNG
jgi:hypothetical protein